jgi:hypothetical protein
LNLGREDDELGNLLSSEFRRTIRLRNSEKLV